MGQLGFWKWEPPYWQATRVWILWYIFFIPVQPILSPKLEAFQRTYADAFAILNRQVQRGLKKAIFIFLGISALYLFYWCSGVVFFSEKIQLAN